MCSGETPRLFKLQSMNTGVAPQYNATFALAIKFNDGINISSFDEILLAKNAKCIADVPEFVAIV